jgi:uncharacterized protein YcbX
MATVARFNVSPVKSTSLQHPESIDLRENGVAGDHRFMILEADGTRLSGGAKAPFVGIRSDYDIERERLRLSLPGVAEFEGSATAEGEPRSVTLFDRRVTARSVPGPFAAGLSAYTGRELLFVRVDEPENAGGMHRVSLLGLASVADLAARGGEATLDPRRFRMLVEVEGSEPYEEDAWEGQRLRIGEAVVRVGSGVPRCVLTTMNPDSGKPDFPTLEVLAGFRRRGTDLPLGVYGDVEEPGTVRAGDPIELL